MKIDQNILNLIRKNSIETIAESIVSVQSMDIKLISDLYKSLKEMEMLKVGQKVVTKVNTFICKAGDKGVVYENYGTGYGIIFEDGEFDGFSHDEVDEMITPTDEIVPEISGYVFKNVLQLSQDFDNGKFKKAFV